MQCLKKANAYYGVDHGRFQVLKSTLHMTLSEGWRKMKGQKSTSVLQVFALVSRSSSVTLAQRL